MNGEREKSENRCESPYRDLDGDTVKVADEALTPEWDDVTVTAVTPPSVNR